MANVNIIAEPLKTTAIMGSSLLAYLYVVDSGNNRVQVFDYSGNFKFSFGSYGTGNGQFDNPYGITSDNNYLWVTDSGNHRVQKFTLQGVYVEQFGTYGSNIDNFNFPKGIATDGLFLYVVDQNNNRFKILTMTGLTVMAIGEYGSGTNQFIHPTNIAVDSAYIYIDDTGNNRTVIYAKIWMPETYINTEDPIENISMTAAARFCFINAEDPPEKPNLSLIVNEAVNIDTDDIVEEISITVYDRIITDILAEDVIENILVIFNPPNQTGNITFEDPIEIVKMRMYAPLFAFSITDGDEIIEDVNIVTKVINI